MRIAVIGHSGAGKSTLARALGTAYHCPVLHLDTVQFMENWQEREQEEAEKIVRSFLQQADWVIDGNYKSLAYWARMEAADCIIFLHLSRFRCWLQAYRRYLLCRGGVRDSMAPGCIEKFDWEFCRWILWAGRGKDARHRYRQVQQRYPDKFYTCRSPRETAALLRHMTEGRT